MHVAVLGAGIIGVTTAYYLAERGHSVTIIDRADGVATQTSFANGAQLSYSYTDSLARPEFLPQMPGLLLGLDPAIRVNAFRNLSMFAWGMRFLAQCTAAKATENTIAVLKIAMRSASLISELQRKLDLDFSYKTVGKLVVLASEDELDAARERQAMKREHGCETEVLSAEEAMAMEPALVAMDQDFAGAVYSELDEVGDAHLFAVGLMEWLQANKPVTLALGRTVEGLETSKGKVRSVRTDLGSIEADAAVVCMGPWSASILKSNGVDPLIYPVRGYSVTLPPAEDPPTISITNLKHRMVFSRLDTGIRIAGYADFAGFDTSQDKYRIASLLETARRLAPTVADYGAEHINSWGGFRPVTPTGQPQVGATKTKGLFMNTGHGSLGWTLACATADSVAAAISNSN
jgi:D-amino-acid dehydrogenase